MVRRMSDMGSDVMALSNAKLRPNPYAMRVKLVVAALGEASSDTPTPLATSLYGWRSGSLAS
jgi:hypothetical protein